MTSPAPDPRAGRVRATRQKAAVDRALSELEDFVSAQELHAHLKEAGERVSLATVYRTLQQQLQDGTVDVMRREDGESVYRRFAEQGHHHHLVCRRCNRLVDVDCATGEAPCLVPVDDGDFVVDEAEVTYWGTCPECQSATST